MTEQRRTTPKSRAARNAARNAQSKKAEEIELAEKRKRRSIAQAERRTTPAQVRSTEPAPTAAGRAPEGTGAATPSSYLDIPEDYRAGFACFVGRPNAGKSTLTNALVGEKVAITSSKPQTTRRAIRGIVHRASGQLIVVDTPGMHRPRTLLGERLNSVVQDTLAEVDVIGFCVPANEKIGPGDRYINEQLDAFPRAKKVAIVTKIDAASRPAVAEQLQAVSELRDWDSIIPISSLGDQQLDILSSELIALMPLSQPLYPD
ncbi:MAG TPA: GTPase, partial [Actinospica sp.]|nr:GTPase [Actinospica sp.]